MDLFAKFVCFTNVPANITADDFKTAIVQDFPSFFQHAYEVGSLKVKIFKKRQQNAKFPTVRAVVSGINVDFEKLEKAARRKMISIGSEKFGYRVKYDDGDERLANGDFKFKMSGSKRRQKKELRLHSGKVVILPLMGPYADIHAVFDSTCITYLKNRFVEPGQIGAISVHQQTGLNVKVAQFASALECLQSITLYNGSECETREERIQFADKSGRTCIPVLEQGLGITGVFINFEEIEETEKYVNLDALNEDIIDIRALKSIHVNCMKCEMPYSIVGIESDLRWLAAKCYNCRYDIDDITDSTRAYSWIGEDFTRLAPHRRQMNDDFYYDVLFRPMTPKYDSPSNYRRTAIPLARAEFKYRTNNFASHATRAPKFLEARCVGIEEKGEVVNDVYAIKAEVNRNSFWNFAEQMNIGGLTLKFTVEVKKYKRQEERAAKFFFLQDGPADDKTTITATILLARNTKIVKDDPVDFTPTPDKSQYNAVKGFLNKWKKGVANSPALKAILDVTSYQPAEFTLAEINHTYLNDCYSLMRASLNDFQLKAFENALKFESSVVVGVPGSGKTRTCACILTGLHLLEPKLKAIAVAPSHFACDNLCSAIENILDSFFSDNLPFFVVRVYSRTKELMLRYNPTNLGFKSHTKVLHEEIDKKIKAMNDPILDHALNAFSTGEVASLAVDDKDYFWNEYTQLEFDFLQSTNNAIIVCTPSTLMDQRFKGSEGKCPFPLGTLLVDEAGFMSQTDTLPLLDIGQQRVIYAGDDRQLRALISNPAVESAGYANSAIEWARECASDMPIEVLRMQYRMAKPICEIVSDLVYSDTPLQCAPGVPSEVLPEVECLFSSGHHVLVLDHQGLENRNPVTHSFYNEEEARIVASVGKKLVLNGIDPTRISILTAYSEQKRFIQPLLSGSGLEAKTIDSMQGKENDIIILSFVRSGETGIGFLKTENRVNVALSRAKSSLILVMNKAAFRKETIDVVKRMMDLFEKHAQTLDGHLFL